MRRSPRLLLGMLAALLLVLTACGSGNTVTADPSASDFGVIRIGKGVSAETEAIANIYAAALQEAGYTTEVVDTGSTRAGYLQTMRGGSSTAPLVVPDYSGSLLLQATEDGTVNPAATASASAFAGASASATEGAGTSSADSGASSSAGASADASAQGASASSSASSSSLAAGGINVNGMSSADILSTLPRVLPSGIGILDAADAQNKDALVVTKATAAKYNLSTIADLASHCSSLVFGVPSGFASRSYGTAGLKKLYGCTPGQYVVQDSQARLADQLAQDTVQVADIFTASAAIQENDFTVLEDPQADFIAQQVVPVVRTDALPDSAKSALNTVSGKLKTSDLVFLDQLMSGDSPVSAKDAAAFWWEENRD